MNTSCRRRTGRPVVLAAAIWLATGIAAFAQGNAPVPDPDAQAKVIRLIQELYEQDLKQARLPAERTVLAEKMLQQATKAKVGTAEHYVLLNVAKATAVQAGDAQTALGAVEQIARTYDVDSAKMKLETLIETSDNVRLPEQRKAVLEQSMPLINAVAAEDDYATATRLLEMALPVARNTREAELIKHVVALGKRIAAARDAYAGVQHALKALEENPTDPEANYTVGSFYCVHKGDWDKGIPMLALGSDEQLKELARKELTEAGSPEAQVALGDAWWDLGQRRLGSEKAALVLRARYWYRQGQAEITSALIKMKIQKRLDDIAELQRSVPELAAWECFPAMTPFHEKQTKQYRPLPSRAPKAPAQTAIRLLQVLEGHENSVTSVGFSTDGKLLASGSVDGTVKLWDVSSGKVLATLQADQGPVWCVAFSPAGTILASGGANKQATVWDATSREPLRTLEHPGLVRGLAFSPDGSLLATACHDKMARVWDISTGRAVCILEGHTQYVPSVAFSPDGLTLASAGHDATVRLWDVRTGRARSTLTDNLGLVMSVVFSPDGGTLASAGSPPPRLWDIRTHKVRATLAGHGQQVNSMAFHPRGAVVATGSRDQTVRFWEAFTGRLLHTAETGTEQIFVSFSFDGSLLAGAGHDNKVRVWKLYEGAR